MRHRLLVPLLLVCLSFSIVRQGSAEPQGGAIISLTSWENVLFGRWVAIDNIVRSYTTHYGIPNLWTMQTFAAESVMDPLAQGSQPDDRGIGQVGYGAEAYGRRRGTDVRSPDYEPDLRANGSIWDPRTNVILASIWYRWVYNQPYVRTPAQAYAVSTCGPGAVLPDGTIRWDAQQRVDRAKSFYSLLASFERVKRQTRSYSWAQLVAAVPDPMTRDIIYIDSHTNDGADAYAKLSARYLEEVRRTRSPWTVVMFGREALRYLDEGRIAYRTDQHRNYAALAIALGAKRGLFAGGGDLLSQYNRLLSEARSR